MENKRKRIIAKDNHTAFWKHTLEVGLFDKYKLAMKLRGKGIPDWMNTYEDMIKNPEYYFGYIPKLGEDDE